MSLTAKQIARAKKIIEREKRRIDLSKLSRADAVLVFRYAFRAPLSIAEEAVAYAQGRFRGDVIELDRMSRTKGGEYHRNDLPQR